MNDVESFKAELIECAGSLAGVRPFVCDGSPLDCKVFIVGFNPATTMHADFWTFWNEGKGFHKERWFKEYKLDRQNADLKPGKMRRNEVSNSRRVIEWVIAGAYPIKCLETNVYATPSATENDLPIDLRKTPFFKFLLNAIEPQIIVAHGKVAAAEVRRLMPAAHVIEVKHFSRGWSQSAATELGERIRSLMAMPDTFSR